MSEGTIEAKKAEISQLQSKIAQVCDSKRNVSLQDYIKDKSTLPLPRPIKCRRSLKGHFGKVTALHWGGDSKTLVSASQDGKLLIWNTLTSHKLDVIELKSNYVMSVGMEQSQNALVACGGLDNLCTVYRRSSNNNNAPTILSELASHDGFLSCTRFRNTNEILTSSGDSTCILWNIERSKPLQVFAQHTADALHMDWKDNNVFCSCSVDRSCKIWDVRSPELCVQTYTHFHLGDVNCVEFVSDGNVFGSCSQDHTVRLFDMRSYNQLAVYGTALPPSALPGEGYTSCSFSSSGRLAFCGDSEGNVLAYDTLTGQVAVDLSHTAHDKHVSSVQVSPSGNAVCSGSWDSTLKVFA